MSIVNTNQATGSVTCGCDTPTKSGSITYRPPMDIYQYSDRYELHLDLPGSSADQIEATIDDDVLTVQGRVAVRYAGDITPIHAEFGVGDFERRVRLGEDVDPDQLSAGYQDGVLRLVLPKRAERQPRRVTVKPGN